MKHPGQKAESGELAPGSQGRRFFIGGMATLGAGLAGFVILPTTAYPQPRSLQPTREASGKQNPQHAFADAVPSWFPTPGLCALQS
jgi:hypothetical protein